MPPENPMEMRSHSKRTPPAMHMQVSITIEINRGSTSSKAQEGTSPSIHGPSSPPVAPLAKSDPQATPTPWPFSRTSSPLPAHAASTDPGPRGRVSARAPWTAYPCCRAADTAARYRFCTRTGPPTARRRPACAGTTARGKP